MKKALLALAAVALLFATSCKKESVNPAVDVPEGSFLATIDNGANPQNAPAVKDGMGIMTTIDANRYVIWENEDEIKINGVSYTTDTEGSSSVVFTPSDPAQQAIGTTFHAFYPASIAGTDAAGTLPATQTIEFDTDDNLKVSHLPMYATSTNNQLTFHNICAVLKIEIPAFFDGATRIEVSTDKALHGTFTIGDNFAAIVPPASSDADKKLTVKKQNDIAFATGNVVYIAVPAMSYEFLKVEFFNGATSMWTKTAGTQENPIVLAVNKVYNVNITEMPDPNLLSGLFTINKNGDQVKFTKGDLNGSSPNYDFETSQLSSVSKYPWTTAWQSNVTVSGREYRVLTKDEFNYLLKTRTMAGTTPQCKMVTINGDFGLVLYPDNYTGSTPDSYTTDEWQTAEQNGLVCLFRDQQFATRGEFEWGGSGIYWTATKEGSENPYNLTFQLGGDIVDGEVVNVFLSNSTDASHGLHIRLVKDYVP